MCVEYCSLKIFEFTQTNSYGGEDNWVTPRLVTEKARNNPEGNFAFPPRHIIAPFSRFCKIFCGNLCCLQKSFAVLWQPLLFTFRKNCSALLPPPGPRPVQAKFSTYRFLQLHLVLYVCVFICACL